MTKEGMAALVDSIRVNPGKLDEWLAQGGEPTIVKLAELAKQVGDFALARECYIRLYAHNKKNTNALGYLADCERMLGMHGESERHWRKLLNSQPENVTAWFNLGVVCAAQQHYEEAIAAYNRVLRLQPDMVQAMVNKASALQTLRKEDEAHVLFERAAVLHPDSVEALSGLGQNHLYRGDYASACAVLERAFAIHPHHADLLDNLVMVLTQSGDFAKAGEYIEQGLKAGVTQALYSRALLRLLQGNLAEGAVDYEARLTRYDFVPKAFTQPVWQGEDLRGKALLVWGEQGIGDEIMFASLLPDIAERCGKLVLEVDPRLVALFARSFPKADVYGREHNVRVDPRLLERDDIDVQTAMGSLMRFAKPGLHYPSGKGYLQADAAQAQALRARYEIMAQGKKRIGISWHSTNPQTGQLRTMRLADWLPILRLPGAQFYSLQYGDFDEEMKALKQAHGIEVYKDEAIDPLKDMDAFAAQMAAMDLVISCANSTVHMAGALGVPAWVMTPHVPSWRWFMDREDSYWYAHVRLFRQQAPGEWGAVIEKVAGALATKFQQRV